MKKINKKYYKVFEIISDKEIRYQIEFGYLNEKMSNKDCNKVVFDVYKKDGKSKIEYNFYAEKKKDSDTIDNNMKLYKHWKEIINEIVKLEKRNEDAICKSIINYLIRNNFYKYTENMGFHWNILFK